MLSLERLELVSPIFFDLGHKRNLNILIYALALNRYRGRRMENVLSWLSRKRYTYWCLFSYYMPWFVPRGVVAASLDYYRQLASMKQMTIGFVYVCDNPYMKQCCSQFCCCWIDNLSKIVHIRLILPSRLHMLQPIRLIDDHFKKWPFFSMMVKLAFKIDLFAWVDFFEKRHRKSLPWG